MAATQFVQHFHDTYKGVSPMTVEQGRAMGECMGAVDQLSRLVQELVANLDADALANVEELQPWLRSSVERCVFARVGQTLWHLYDGRHSAEDAQYAQKVRDLSRVSDRRLFDALEVRWQFRGSEDELVQPLGFQEEQRIEPMLDNKAVTYSEMCEGCRDEGLNEDELKQHWNNLKKVGSHGSASTASPSECASPSAALEAQCVDSAIGSSMTRSSDAETEETNSRQAHFSNTAPFSAATGGLYERAAAALSQIEISLLSKSGRRCTPRDAIEALTFSQFEMKTCALEASCGQLELCAMDDILPVFVFVLVRSALTKPFACARFMNDALSRDEALESEGRAVLLLESAARHIAYDWDITSLLSESGSP